MFKFILSAALFVAVSLGRAEMHLYRLPGNSQKPAYVLFDELGFSAHGLTPVRLGNKFGYVDDTGSVVIPQRGPFVFTEARKFAANGLAVVQVEERYGYIDREGRWAIPAKFDTAEDFEENVTLAVVSTNGMFGIIDRTGRELLPIRYELVKRLEADRFAVSDGSGWALADRDAKLLTPFHFQSLGNRIGNGAEGRVPAQKDDRWGFVDGATGQFVIPAIYDEVGRFSEGFANFSLDERIGFVDLSGRVLVNPRFERADEFSQGLAAVQLDGKWGYLDEKGQLVIEPAYARAYKFSDGNAAVRRPDGTLMTINRRGEVVPEPPAEPARFRSTEELRAELGLVGKPCSCTVRWSNLNLGADLKWDGESRASGVRLFTLDTRKTLVWDAALANGVLQNGIFRVNGQTVLLGDKFNIRPDNLEAGLAAALRARQKQLTATPAEATPRMKKELQDALTAILADIERIEGLGRALFFGVDNDAFDETHAATRRIDKARPYVDAVKGITTKIDEAFRTLPMLDASQRTMLDNIRKKQAAELQNKLRLP
jgi:hypothetical protein